MSVLVTGGARSGKSSFAERYAQKLGSKGIYIATAQAYDDEMRERLALHRERREQSGFCWETVEEPLDLAELIRSLSRQTDAVEGNGSESGTGAAEGVAERKDRVVLVDCLTLWLSNWVLRYENDPNMDRLVAGKVEELAEAVRAFNGPLLLVTNEVGSGIVPEYRLGRVYRDLAGRMNQRIAEQCGQVFLVACGIPVDLKRLSFQFDE